MEFKDYYAVMGVSRDASADDIKRAYRRLARKYHPDVSKEADAEVRFKEMQEAYEVLKDPEKRAAYDRFGKDWKAGQEFRPPPDWQHDFQFGGGGFTGGSGFSDFFEALFGRGGFAGAGMHGHGGMRGQDQNARIRVTLDEAHAGTTRVLTLQSPEIGPDGRGVMRERTLNVRIPAGVTAGQRIRLAGQGGPGFEGAPAGDLFLTVEFEPHPLFRTEQRDVHLELPVTPWEAALGATVKVPTLGGRVDLKIPRGSQSGGRLRLKGRGLPGKPPGDQYVTLRVVTPSADSPEAEALYRRMAQVMPLDPRAHLEGARR